MTTFVVPTEAPTVHGPPQGQWTYADWEQLPDDGNRYVRQALCEEPKHAFRFGGRSWGLRLLPQSAC